MSETGISDSDSDLYDSLVLARKLYIEGKGTLEEYRGALKLIKETFELRRKAREHQKSVGK